MVTIYYDFEKLQIFIYKYLQVLPEKESLCLSVPEEKNFFAVAIDIP